MRERWSISIPAIATLRTSHTENLQISIEQIPTESGFLRLPIPQVGIDELQPRSIGVGQSRHARDKELL
jgi:hypothetical protein